MPTSGSATAAATARSCCSAIGRTAGPERPPWPAARAGAPVRRIDRARLQRVDQRDRVGPALLGGDRDRGRVGDVGRQLHDQRLRGQRAQRLQQRHGLGRLLADDQARVDVRAGDVELDRRDLVALRQRPRPVARTPPGWSPSPRRSAAPAARPAAAGPRPGSPSRPLFGSPIELIIPAGVSQIRCGALPARGSGVIVFETKAEKGKSSSSASPKTRRAAIAS